ncbi:hypothetical protein ACPXCE_16615 [Streptomyces sp. DT24]|uniref:hypothetical protein n=1 Tax=unclassified Streptomyces TaxID=2593676 RepID=UPI0023B9DA37|nr:hypothetical protein [Streptomyces sp. AM 4-1-1]WEH35287.1 hypothetical protein PZB75_19140 [Streptomyces sp. AM 4-1-1]
MSSDEKIQVPAPKTGTVGDVTPQDSHMTGQPVEQPLPVGTPLPGKPKFDVKPLDSHMTGEPVLKTQDSHMTGGEAL